MVCFFCLGAQVWFKLLADYGRTLWGSYCWPHCRARRQQLLFIAGRRGGWSCHEHPCCPLAQHHLLAWVLELCPRLPTQAVWLLLTQRDTLSATSLGSPVAAVGTPQKASGCVFLQGLGFLISKCSPKAASPWHASYVPAYASSAAHGWWGFATCTFFWSSQSFPLGGPTHALSRGRWPSLKQTQYAAGISAFSPVFILRCFRFVGVQPRQGLAQQILEHVVVLQENFLHWFLSGEGNLWGRISPQSFQSHQEQERATAVCRETCPENKLGQHAASLGTKGDTREQKETKHQTSSRQLCYINTCLGSGALPGSCVNTPRQHYPIPVTLKPGEKITIWYCTQRPVPHRSLHGFVVRQVLF